MTVLGHVRFSSGSKKIKSFDVQDHFSSYAADYRENRPQYPPKLFQYLALLVPQHKKVWDCATGNGQAAVGLADHFKEVLATDASADQIRNGTAKSNISYCIAAAESSGLEDESIDLVTVAQALHWLDTEKFYQEVRRVSKKHGVLAVWCYDLLSVSPEVDAVINRFYRETMRKYWFPERYHIETGYSSLRFPFERMQTPPLSMTASWDLAAITGYLRTWSAVHNYIEREGSDPLSLIDSDLKSAWGNPEEVKRVIWPLSATVGKVH